MPIGSFRARVMHTSPGRVDMLMASVDVRGDDRRARRSRSSRSCASATASPTARDPDFKVNTQAEFRETQEAITDALSALLLVASPR